MNLDTSRSAGWAMVLVPIAFAVLSFMHGQDANWDLYNYHLYNAYAFLHDKIGVDLAPAGAQSYFNPALDVAYYLLLTGPWPAMAGLLLGALHGLHFVVLYGIARAALGALPNRDARRVPLLLALAGCLSANFLAGLGNTMGDDTTSLFQVGALFLLVSRSRELHLWSPRLASALAGAGILCGLGVGLKLTNAVYALAMCLALLFVGGTMASRARNAALFGCAALLGFAVTGGYWIAEMWTRFGNPLFPQFGNLFPHPLTQAIGALDDRWRPRGILELAAWPFILSLNPGRVSELRVYELGWMFWYVLMLAWLAMRVWAPWRGRLQGDPGPGARLVVIFVALGYVIWVGLFSIYRYIVPIETLLPLVLWILLTQIFPYARARSYAKRLITLCVVGTLVLGLRTWGHVNWSEPPFEVETPAGLDPGRDTVIVAEQPMAWLAAGFPPEVAFASVLSSFPESPRYATRLRELIRERGGDALLMVMERRNWRADTVARLNRTLREWGVLDSEAACSALGRLLAHTRLHASLVSPGTRTRCELGLRPGDRKDLVAENREAVRELGARIARYGLALDAQSCETYGARYGDVSRPYRLCRVRATG